MVKSDMFSSGLHRGANDWLRNLAAFVALSRRHCLVLWQFKIAFRLLHALETNDGRADKALHPLSQDAARTKNSSAMSLCQHGSKTDPETTA